ncbi:MAG: molybdopterin oxidoreductase, partial [Mailhella sp.]|nr:molybdopterin oxidoreductase [Mailhella sp.]
VPLVLENRVLARNKFVHAVAHNFHVIMPLFAGIGAFLSTFHQGSLGGLYGVLFGRPYLYREGFFIWPWTFFLFILSAISCGPMFTTLICALMEKMTGRKLVSWDIKQLMGRIGGTMLLIYAVFKFADTYFWATNLAPREGLTFDQMFHGVAYGKWLLYTELALIAIPAVLLLIPATRKTPFFFYLALIMTCCGVTVNRWVQTVQGSGMPVMPFDKWYLYVPNYVEWGACLMVFAFAGIVLSLAYRYCPMFPQEAKLNAKD